MTRKNVVRMLTRGALFVGAASVMLGCDADRERDKDRDRDKHPAMDMFSNNRSYVKCQKNINGADPEVEIKDGGLANPDDDVIFVCAGEKIRWFTNDDGLSFTIDFDNLGNSGSVFKSRNKTLNSKVGNQADPHHQHPRTDDEVIEDRPPSDKHLIDHVYKLITKKNGHVTTIDPHVIPM